MSSPVEYSALILVHVVSGSLWASIAFFFAAFLAPAIGEAGPGGGAVMGGLMRRKMPVLMLVLSTLAVLTGLRLYMIRWAGTEWLFSAHGMVLTLGGLAALHAYVKGLLVTKPLAERLGALAAKVQAAPDPALQAELQAGQVRMARLSKAAGYELLAAMVLMSGHRLAALF